MNYLKLKRLHAKLSHWIGKTPLRHIPVVVRKGIARGARWTLFPFSAYWRGNYELDTQQVILRYGCEPGSVCWDLGAHYGFYTVGMALRVGVAGQVVSFEPDPLAFDRLMRHIRMNGLTNVKAYSAAVSDHEGFCDILICNNDLGNSKTHLAYPDENMNQCFKKIKVPSIKLDNLIEQDKVRPPNFLKIDVEGHGALALKGARQMIARFKPVIVMSFHGLRELHDTREVLAPLNYHCFSIKGDPIEWDNVTDTALLKCSI